MNPYDFTLDAHILRQHAQRANAFLRQLYERSDLDPALLDVTEKRLLAALLDESADVLDMTREQEGNA